MAIQCSGVHGISTSGKSSNRVLSTCRVPFSLNGPDEDCFPTVKGLSAVSDERITSRGASSLKLITLRFPAWRWCAAKSRRRGMIVADLMGVFQFFRVSFSGARAALSRPLHI